MPLLLMPIMRLRVYDNNGYDALRFSIDFNANLH